MIPEALRDTEDWSNDAENNKNISKYDCFCCALDEINAGLMRLL